MTVPRPAAARALLADAAHWRTLAATLELIDVAAPATDDLPAMPGVADFVTASAAVTAAFQEQIHAACREFHATAGALSRLAQTEPTATSSVIHHSHDPDTDRETASDEPVGLLRRAERWLATAGVFLAESAQDTPAEAPATAMLAQIETIRRHALQASDAIEWVGWLGQTAAPWRQAGRLTSSVEAGLALEQLLSEHLWQGQGPLAYQRVARSHRTAVHSLTAATEAVGVTSSLVGLAVGDVVTTVGAATTRAVLAMRQAAQALGEPGRTLDVLTTALATAIESCDRSWADAATQLQEQRHTLTRLADRLTGGWPSLPDALQQPELWHPSETVHE
ncbi:hypothetical protein [Parenemella sanctibonifatiensis]|uniref:Uncharacterized protein n=1 Tax=Parenemella sanctibonifatiensis TaxID=2016505 RepID=A0A255ECC5_9ACTN|nr:hypothetical protein [Parenemella sanctibonifatiensis]OYN89207.1 hypothetical protein CGZ92_03100 [Parenemella sanctibonifatiensis]